MVIDICQGLWKRSRGTKKIGLETIELCSALEFRDEKDHLCLCYLSVVD